MSKWYDRIVSIREKNLQSKNHLERILYIDNLIRQERFPSKSIFIEKFEVSAKTIERDLQYMRDRLEDPLEFDRIKKGYYYSNENYFLPSTVMSEGELFALIMSIETVKSIGNPLLIKKLEKSYKKLANYLPENIKIDLQTLVDHSIIVTPPGLPLNENIWKVLIDGIKLRKKVKIDYQSPGHRRTVERELIPYYLLSNKRGWYLLAMNKIRNRIETYAVFRMKKAKLLNSKFVIPDNFKPEDYIDPEMGIFSSTKKYNIEIEFDSETTPYIKERIWHTDQTIIEKNDGTIILKFKTNQLESVKFQLLPWGAGAKVIAPEELREMMVDTIEEMRERYQK